MARHAATIALSRTESDEPAAVGIVNRPGRDAAFVTQEMLRRQRITNAIDRWAFDGINGPENAAVRVLADTEIRDALAAVAVLGRLRDRHQPVSWGEGSNVVVCSCTQAIAYDACPDGLILRGEG